MSDTKLLQPAPERRVRKPDGALLAPAGERVEVDTYWTRRILDGDVVEIADAKPAKTKGGA